MNARGSTQWLLLARRFRGILWPRRWQVVAILLLILLTSFLEGVSFSLIVPLMETFTSSGSNSQGVAAGLFGMYDEGLAGYSLKARLAILGCALIGLFVFKNGVQFLREVLSTRLWVGISTTARTNLFTATLQKPYLYFQECKQGALVQHLYHEPFSVAVSIQIGLEQVANLLAAMVLVGLLMLVSWQVTVLVIGFGAFYSGMVWLVSKKVQVSGEERQKAEAEAVSIVTEAIAGIRQIKVFSAECRLQTVYETWINRFQRVQTWFTIAGLIPHRITELFWIGVLGLLLCLPVLGLIDNVQTVLPVVAVFSAVLFRVGPYLSRISQGWLTVKFYLPAMHLIGSMLEDSSRQSQDQGKRQFEGFSQSIRLQDVTFSYGGSHPALSHVSVDFNRGETTAIIGPSGSGKSTLVDLLVRLHESFSGRITVDGIDLRDFERDSWLAKIGFVSQDTFIFHGTIRENIAFSRPESTLEDIQSAARQANAHDFIMWCPEGYETVVGDRGLKLSGGERQRIAIARALLRKPEILIFDEATSALDNQSEASVQEAIAEISGEHTVILIAHRLSTVVHADKIVVLENGSVIEEGTHASLLKENGLYASLYSGESA